MLLYSFCNLVRTFFFFKLLGTNIRCLFDVIVSQTYIQLATTRSEEIGEKMKLKERDIEVWIAKNGLPKEMKTSIMQKVKHKLEENYNKDVDVENLLSILSSEDRKSIKRLLCLPMLKQVSNILQIIRH